MISFGAPTSFGQPFLVVWFALVFVQTFSAVRAQENQPVTPATPPTEAQTAAANPYAICITAQDEQMPWMDRTHERLSRNVCYSAIWFDRFFGDEGAEEIVADRYIRVIGWADWQENAHKDLDIKIRARFDLPHLRKFGQRLALVFSDEDESDVTTIVREQNEEDPNLSPGETKQRTMGLRWQMLSKASSSLSLNTSIHLRFPFKPSFNARYHYTHHFSTVSLLRFSQNAFWQWEEGLGERTRVDMEHLLTPTSMIRWSNSALYSQESDGLEWVSNLGWYYTTDHKQSTAVDASINGYTAPSSRIDAYRVGFRHRQNFLRSWLFWQIEPYVQWQYDENYRPTFGATLEFEVLLGQRKSGAW